jgi:hypothetical protein
VPASGDAVQKVIRDTIAAPREIVEKTRAIVRMRPVRYAESRIG